MLLSVIGWARAASFGGASWAGQPYSVTMPTHITALGQSFNSSSNLTLQHDVSCSIGVSVAQAGDEILTNGGATLTTSYKLTGAGLQNGDAGWVASTAFLAHTYNVPSTGPTDIVTISVKADAPADHAPEAGAYTASIILTVSW